MSEINGVGGRRHLDRNDYDSPLPGEQQRQAKLVANAGVPGDLTKIKWEEPRYSPLLFTNRAMQSLSAIATPPPTTQASAPLKPAREAFEGIKLEPVARDLPPIDRSDTTRAVDCGIYRLYPQLRRQADGSDGVVCWKAVNRDTKRADFVVGPGALATFKAHAKDYEEIALRVFANGDPDAATVASMQVMDVAMEKGFVTALKELPGAWNTARGGPGGGDDSRRGVGSRGGRCLSGGWVDPKHQQGADWRSWNARLQLRELRHRDRCDARRKSGERHGWKGHDRKRAE